MKGAQQQLTASPLAQNQRSLIINFSKQVFVWEKQLQGTIKAAVVYSLSWYQLQLIHNESKMMPRCKCPTGSRAREGSTLQPRGAEGLSSAEQPQTQEMGKLCQGSSAWTLGKGSSPFPPAFSPLPPPEGVGCWNSSPGQWSWHQASSAKSV